ncbi:leucine-rich repeat-containing G-protein coupled receptor 6-like [Calliphora vicina]|uniref:leucine-rich repeat-containing G-protein coupled receptor 6-like n=1 Tax=Calliphora vicina TaxID=7373 RepID=UPI00325C0016
MKGFKVFFMIILTLKAIKTATKAETPHDKDQGSAAAPSKHEEDQQENLILTSYKDDYDEEELKTPLKQIQLYNDDERCSENGLCSDMDYGNRDEVVTFARKLKIRFTSQTTYKVLESRNSCCLTFKNSKFANFPLNLFEAFRIEELDFRNCSLKTLKRDNFLRAENLSILLMSENLLSEIKPMLFTYVDNLSFLFLDSNRLSILYKDSFKGLDKLNYLDLHNNFIETLPSQIFSYMPYLQQINLSQNRLKIIKYSLFAYNPRLFSIHLQRNNLKAIQEYAFKHQETLKHLDISHNSNLKTLVCVNLKVEYLWAKNCSLKRLNIYGEVVNGDLRQNSLKELYFNQPEYLETLSLKDNSLEQISCLQRATNLLDLDVSHNPQLKTLNDFYQFNSLERLDLSNTSLQEIPVNIINSSPKLRALNISFNQLQEIKPLNFKYLQKLTQFYIHHNNWQCYNLQLLMDKIIKPLKISFTRDKYDHNFPGEYIQGIKCMPAREQTDYDYQMDSYSSRQLDITAQELFNSSNSLKQEFQNLEYINDAKELSREFKSIFQIYEQKFNWIFNKLNNMDLRLRKFERLSESLWRNVGIMF